MVLFHYSYRKLNYVYVTIKTFLMHSISENVTEVKKLPLICTVFLEVLPVPLRVAQFLSAVHDFLNQQLQLISPIPAWYFFQVEMEFLRIFRQNSNSCTADPRAPTAKFLIELTQLHYLEGGFCKWKPELKGDLESCFLPTSLILLPGFKRNKMLDQDFKMIKTMEATSQVESKQMVKVSVLSSAISATSFGVTLVNSSCWT